MLILKPLPPHLSERVIPDESGVGLDIRRRCIDRMIDRVLVFGETPRHFRVGGNPLHPIARGGDVVETLDISCRHVGIAQESRLIQGDQNVDRVRQSEMRRGQSDISAVTVSNDVELLAGRKRMSRDHLPQRLSRRNPMSVIVPAGIPGEEPSAITLAVSSKRVVRIM